MRIPVLVLPGERRETRNVGDDVRLGVRVRLVGDQRLGRVQLVSKPSSRWPRSQKISPTRISASAAWALSPAASSASRASVDEARATAWASRACDRPRVAEEQDRRGPRRLGPELDRGAVEAPGSVEGAERVRRGRPLREAGTVHASSAPPSRLRRLDRARARSGSGARASRRDPRDGPSDSIHSAAP